MATFLPEDTVSAAGLGGFWYDALQGNVDYLAASGGCEIGRLLLRSLLRHSSYNVSFASSVSWQPLRHKQQLHESQSDPTARGTIVFNRRRSIEGKNERGGKMGVARSPRQLCSREGFYPPTK